MVHYILNHYLSGVTFQSGLASLRFYCCDLSHKVKHTFFSGPKLTILRAEPELIITNQDPAEESKLLIY